MKTGLYLGGTPIGKIIAASAGGGGLALQSKSVNPTKQTQTITPDAAYDALSQVVVNPIPGNYITTETNSAPEPDQMEAGTTAYANGETITGTLPLISEDITQQGDDVRVSGSNLIISLINGIKRIFGIGSSINLQVPLSDMGDATAEDVVAGKTFTSTAGLKVTGTHECETGADLSGVTALQDYTLKGQTTYLKTDNNSEPTLIEGTMTDCRNFDLTLTGSTVRIPNSGYYSSEQKYELQTASLTDPYVNSATLGTDGNITVEVGYTPARGYNTDTTAKTATTTVASGVSTETWTLTDINGNTSTITVVNI